MALQLFKQFQLADNSFFLELVKTHKMKKSLIILLLFVVGISNAQNVKVQGIVTDSLGTAIEMANIMAVNLDLDKMDGYSITGEKGQYALNLKPNSNYQLKVSYLGFSPKTVDVITKTEDLTLPIVLSGGETLLDEIEIVHQMPVSIKGDTIVYNADSFTSGTERKLGDILKKLPGIEVDDDGNVKVEGKGVQKLMIEGKDFFDGDTKLGVNNIPADAVDKVEVLRNYNENDQLRSVTDNQDNLAMNIKLKEGKKNFWFGDISVGAGASPKDGRYVVNPKLFYYSQKYSLNFITNLNNTGEQPMSFSDYFRMSGGFKNLARGSSLSLSGNDLGIPLMPDNMAKEVTNRFGAANFSYNPTKEWTISGFGIISDNKTDMENWSRNQILNTETGEVLTTQESDTNNRLKSEMTMLKFSSNYKPNQKVTFDYDVFFKKSQQTEDYHLQTQVSPNTEQSQEITTFKKQNPVSFNQNIGLYYAPDNKNVFAFEVQHLYQDEDPFYNANLATQPFDLAGYIDGQLRQNIYQERFLKTNKIDAKADYYYALTKKSNLNITLGNTYSYQNFNSHIFQILDNGTQNDLTSPELNNQVSYAFNDIYLGLRYKFITGKFTFNPGITAHSYSMEDTQSGNANHRTFTRFLPDFDVKYEIRRSKTLNYRFAMTNNFTDIMKLAESYILQGYSSLYAGNRHLENSTAQTHNLYYSSYSTFNQQHISANISYSKTMDNINSISEYDGINRTSTSFNSNFADQSLGGNVRYGKTFARYYKANASASMRWAEHNIIQVNPATNNTTEASRASFSQQYSASLRTTFDNIPNVELGYAISINKYPEETSYTSSPKVNLDYYFLESFSLTADYTLNNYQNKSRTINNQFDFLNASLAYQKKDSKWEYRLSATNLLNTKTRNSDFFNQFSIVTSQYWIQPRYVIFTLKYNL